MSAHGGGGTGARLAGGVASGGTGIHIRFGSDTAFTTRVGQ